VATSKCEIIDASDCATHVTRRRRTVVGPHARFDAGQHLIHRDGNAAISSRLWGTGTRPERSDVLMSATRDRIASTDPGTVDEPIARCAATPMTIGGDREQHRHGFDVASADSLPPAG